MNKKEIRKQLKNSQEEMKPDQEWVKENRSALLSEIKQDKKEEQTSAGLAEKVNGLLEVLIPRKAVLAVETAVFVFAIVFVAVGGWTASVKASYSSLPGETLYNVKMITEKAKVAVTEVVGTESEKAKLHSKLATRRAQELKEVVKKKEEDPKQVQETIDKMNSSINQAQSALKKAENNKEKSSGETTQEVVQQTELIVKTLSSVLVDVSNGSVDLVDDVAIAQGKITKDSLKLMEGMVRSQLQGEIDLSEEEIQTLVSQTVSKLSKESVKTRKIAASLDEDAVEEIAAGVANRAEEKEEKKKDEMEDKGTGSSSTEKAKKDKKQDNNSEDSDDEDNKEAESQEEQNESDSSEEKVEDDVESATSSPESAITTTTTSGIKKTEEKISAEQLAEKGDLLEAISKLKNVSTKNSKEIQKIVKEAMIKTREDKNGKTKEELFLEYDNQGETVTTTVPIEQQTDTSTTGTNESTTNTNKKETQSEQNKETTTAKKETSTTQQTTTQDNTSVTTTAEQEEG